MLRHAMLCYAMLRYAMLRYAMLCYAVLRYAMLRYAVLCYAGEGGRGGGPLASIKTRHQWTEHISYTARVHAM